MARLRIISGEFGGRSIKAPDGRTTHPMGDRVRTALFNMVEVEGLTVLDAYAGSGAIGLEALSRGAAKVDFIENDRRAQRIISENITSLGVEDRAKLYKVSVETFLNKIGQSLPKYDMVFLDPPYHLFKNTTGVGLDFSTGWQLKSLLKPNGLMVLSYPGRLCASTVNGVVVVDKRRYGEAALAIFRFET